MVDEIHSFPWWMPERLWRIIRTPWFACCAFGLSGFYGLSLVNDFTGTIPLWVRLATGVFTALMVRFGIAIDWHRFTREYP